MEEEIKKMIKDGILKTKIDIEVTAGTNICKIVEYTVSKDISYDHIIIKELDTIIGFPVYFREFYEIRNKIRKHPMKSKLAKTIAYLETDFDEKKLFNDYIGNLYILYKDSTSDGNRITKTEFIKELLQKEYEAHKKFVDYETFLLTNEFTSNEKKYIKEKCNDFIDWINKEVNENEKTTYNLPQLNKTLILLNDEIINKLHNELKGLFSGKEDELLKALQGKQLDTPLLFPHNQNKFVEVFKRLKYNGYLLSTPKEIENWICSNFSYQYRKGNKKEVRNFNASTVHDILTKERCEPPKKERICTPDWLKYKSYSIRQRESGKENF